MPTVTVIVTPHTSKMYTNKETVLTQHLNQPIQETHFIYKDFILPSLRALNKGLLGQVAFKATK